MLRRLAIVVVTVVGCLAVMATSTAPEPVQGFTSPPKSITLVLDENQPEIRFVVAIDTEIAAITAMGLRADITVDNDGDAANDGLALVDVALLPAGGDFAVDVDVPGDASQASVQEGAFGLERSLTAAETELVLAARLREGVSTARVTFVLVADVFAAGEGAGAGGEVVVSVTPATDDTSGDNSDNGDDVEEGQP